VIGAAAAAAAVRTVATRSGFDRHGRACPGAWVARRQAWIATNGGAVRSSRKTAFGAGEVVRPQRTAKKKARSYALLATSNL
jgi:hypothetical protein